MIPNVYVRTLNLPVSYRECKLVTVARVGEKQKAVKRHVEVDKILVFSKIKIVRNDPFAVPNQTETIFTHYSIAFCEQGVQFIREV